MSKREDLHRRDDGDEGDVCFRGCCGCWKGSAWFESVKAVEGCNAWRGQGDLLGAVTISVAEDVVKVVVAVRTGSKNRANGCRYWRYTHTARSCSHLC